MRTSTLRSFALTLPEAEERDTWETATFRVRDRIFMMFSEHGLADRAAQVSKAFCLATTGRHDVHFRLAFFTSNKRQPVSTGGKRRAGDFAQV